MADILLHPTTASALEQFVARGFHAGLIAGPAGSGKSTLSRHLGSRLLGLSLTDLDKYPYARVVAPVDNKAIPIESIRELQHFMTLKIPVSGATDITRLAIIEDAHLLTTEAQNALLKTLEEPPDGTVLILTSSSPEVLLPTIRSRVQTLNVVPPVIEDVKSHFNAKYLTAEIDKAMLVSGGLPGLTQALLSSSESHPLYEATIQARALLQSGAYDRLVLVDALSKQKQLCLDILFILGQMSRMALTRLPDSSTPAAQRWQRVHKATYEAAERLRRNTQPKLVLTDLILAL